MNNSSILEVLEEHNIDRDLIDRVASALKEDTETVENIDNSVDGQVLDLQNQIDGETDWRVRAAKSARIISLKLK